MKNVLRFIPSLLFLSFQTQAATMVFHANKISRQLQTVNQVSTEDANGLITEINFSLPSLDYNTNKMNQGTFTDLKVPSLTNSSNPGLPSLPFKAIIVPGTPNEIDVELDLGTSEQLSNIIPSPAQKELCRCELDKKNPFIISQRAYQKVTPIYKVESLGDYRGVQYSRVVISPMSFDGSNQELTVYPNLNVKVLSRGETKNSSVYENIKSAQLERGLYDYLIISPKSLADGLTPFIQWKRKFGHVIKLAYLEDLSSLPGSPSTSADVKKFVRAEYNTHKFSYALIVGNEKIFPTNYLATSGSQRTPSDSAYFIMGDATDIIPDVFYARLVSDSIDDIKNQTSKWMSYENANIPNLSGYTKDIGIASNEGSNPSDNEYVLSIEKRLNDKAGITATHFFQDAGNGTPAGINSAFNAGALWAIYMGHGTGTAWPSSNGYTAGSISLMSNVDQVKPVLIDVACQNGKLLKGHFGERMVNTASSNGPMGVTAYYGGSVNISWHPPAILARGVIYNYFDKKLTTLGESLLAGHMYLAENYSDRNEFIYNYRWFHLFGDPSMRLRDSLPVTNASTLSVKATDHGNYLLTKDGLPLANATITFFDSSEMASVAVTSDAKGEFALSNQKEDIESFTHFYHWEKNKGLSQYSL
jgi:hypothetical protein